MKTVFTKKIPCWIEADSFFDTVACHCNVQIYPIYKIRRFIFLFEYRYLLDGRKNNINCFERYANVKCKR